MGLVDNTRVKISAIIKCCLSVPNVSSIKFQEMTTETFIKKYQKKKRRSLQRTVLRDWKKPNQESEWCRIQNGPYTYV